MSDLTEREIAQAHTIDDLDRAYGKLKRAVREQLPMLDDARHALNHGSPAVTAEYLERAACALRKALS
jgi:hypothetical protein